MVQGEDNAVIGAGQPAPGAMPALRLGSTLVDISKHCHDAAGLNPGDADKLELGENEPVRIRRQDGALFQSARVVRMAEVPAGEVRLSRRAREALGAREDDSIRLERCALKVYEGTLPQRIESVGEQVIQLPEDDLALLDDGAPYYRLVCEGSNCELVVPRDGIEGFAPEKDSQRRRIKLDRYQRKLLKLELPVELSDSIRSRYLEGMPEKGRLLLEGFEGDDEAEAVEGAYKSGRRDPDADYETARKAFIALSEQGFSRIYLAPLEGPAATKGCSKRRTPWRFLCDAYLGRASITLRAVRPYDLDESKRIVRISPGTMTFLGLEDTDMVRISYGGTSVKARVMPIDNVQEMHATNLLGDDDTLDNLVGIPTAIRHELGLGSIDTCVDVSRDTGYLFAKHLNIQFLALIGMLLTLLQTIPAFDVDPAYVIIAFFVALPFVLYAVLSAERNRVG